MDVERIQAFDASGKALFDGGVVFKDIVQTLPQTTLTLTGTVVAGQMFTVNLDTENNGYTFSFGPYRATSADAAAANPLAAVAQSLASLINAHANYNATATGAK